MSRVLKPVHLQKFLNNSEPQNSQHSGQRHVIHNPFWTQNGNQ